MLVGHDDHYERFAPLDPNGRLDQKRGIPEFVVGTGGKSGWRGFYRFLPFAGRRNPNSEVRNADTFAILILNTASESLRHSRAWEEIYGLGSWGVPWQGTLNTAFATQWTGVGSGGKHL